MVQRLYDLGGRKVVVSNIPPIGCCPYVRDHLKYPSSGEGCVAFPNLLARKYNHQLKETLVELNSKLEGSTIVYADVYRILEDIIHNSTTYGECIVIKRKNVPSFVYLTKYSRRLISLIDNIK